MMDATVEPAAIVQPAGGEREIGAQTTTETTTPGDPADPWENANRGFYAVNNTLDAVAIRPLAMTYQRIVPRTARDAVRRVLGNLDEPRLAVDHLLQGKVKRAGGSVVRFAANSTIGVAGIFDVARHAGFARHDTDFGITLGRHHVGAGPYVYIPVLGPSTLRDLIGTGVDFGLDPLNWLSYRGSTVVANTTLVLKGMDTRAELDRDLVTLKRTAVDPYATVRSVYTQLRESEIRDGAIDVTTLPDFPDEPPAQAPDPSPPPIS